MLYLNQKEMNSQKFGKTKIILSFQVNQNNYYNYVNKSLER